MKSTQPSISVTPVTQDHIYGVNATQDHVIPLYHTTLCNKIQFHVISWNANQSIMEHDAGFGLWRCLMLQPITFLVLEDCDWQKILFKYLMVWFVLCPIQVAILSSCEYLNESVKREGWGGEVNRFSTAKTYSDKSRLFFTLYFRLCVCSAGYHATRQ